MNYFVTGATGFIGKFVTKKIFKERYADVFKGDVNWRKVASAPSRAMPAIVPAAPFTNLTKSSNRRLSLCIVGILSETQ